LIQLSSYFFEVSLFLAVALVAVCLALVEVVLAFVAPVVDLEEALALGSSVVFLDFSIFSGF